MPPRCFDVPHKHITFTISNSLLPFFLIDSSLFYELFDATSYTLLSWFKQQYKLELFILGIIYTLYTFGRDLKWHPHIHILVTEGAMCRKADWKVFDHFPYEMLRKIFMPKLLYNLSKRLFPSDFKKLKNFLYKKNGKGFYVHAPKLHNSNFKISLAYVTRYTNRPVMTESRILDYDGEFITYFYARHEDGKKIEEKTHAFDFIKKLIIHIPEKGFNMVRYYGIYAMTKYTTSNLKRIKEKLTKPRK